MVGVWGVEVCEGLVKRRWEGGFILVQFARCMVFGRQYGIVGIRMVYSFVE